jgi:hypothetical protein
MYLKLARMLDGSTTIINANRMGMNMSRVSIFELKVEG